MPTEAAVTSACAPRAADRGSSYTLNGERKEIGLASLLDVTLARARERATVAGEMLLDGHDPMVARRQSRPVAPVVVAKTFGEFMLELLDSIEDGFKNPKHRQQWRNF